MRGPSMEVQKLKRITPASLASQRSQQQPFCFFLEESFFELLVFLLLFLPLDTFVVALVVAVVVVAGVTVLAVSGIMVDAPAGVSPATEAEGAVITVNAAGAVIMVDVGAAGTKALVLSTMLYWYCCCVKGWKVLALGAPMGKIVFNWSCVKGWACW
mmetsp:Transcript_130913/g.318030  ORF Transcript_130913/g.318030 Transcript_130913/m.318030 type:complete len:157 (+) Transcript_130913:254-724(+)